MNKLALNDVHTALEFHEHHFDPFTLGQAMPSGVSARMLLIIVRALAFFLPSITLHGYASLKDDIYIK